MSYYKFTIQPSVNTSFYSFIPHDVKLLVLQNNARGTWILSMERNFHALFLYLLFHTSNTYLSFKSIQYITSSSHSTYKCVMHILWMYITIRSRLTTHTFYTNIAYESSNTTNQSTAALRNECKTECKHVAFMLMRQEISNQSKKKLFHPLLRLDTNWLKAWIDFWKSFVSNDAFSFRHLRISRIFYLFPSSRTFMYYINAENENGMVCVLCLDISRWA